MGVDLERVRRILKKYEAELLSKPNVLGVGIGYKRVRGVRTRQLCLVVYVEKKVSVDELPPKAVIPRVIEGVVTDVVVSEEADAQGEPYGY
jgi:hypothetical protein